MEQILNSGLSAEQLLSISNQGNGVLEYSALIQYISKSDKALQAVPEGKPVHGQNIQLSKAGLASNSIAPKASKEGVVLNYDGENYDVIGAGAGGTFYGSSRFTSEMVAPFTGYELKSVDVYIGHVPDVIKLMIWDAGTTNSAGELLVSQVFQPVGQSWNTVVLEQPVVLSGSDVWVGFEITHQQGTYILGIDGGPANPNGCFVSSDGVVWEKLTDYGMSFNWNIRALLVYPGINWLCISPSSGSVGQAQSADMTASFNASGMQGGVYTANIIFSSNDYQGTQVIVPVTLTVNAVYYNLDFVINNAEGQAITDAVITLNGTANQAGDYSFELQPGTYNYTVAKEGYFPLSGQVMMGNENQSLTLVMAIDNTSLEIVSPDQVSIFPNPASDYVMVNAPFDIKSIRILAIDGREVMTVSAFEGGGRIYLNGLETGMYIIQMVTNNQILNKQIKVIR